MVRWFVLAQIIIAGAGLFALDSWGQTCAEASAAVTFERPAQRENGDPYPLSEHGGYVLFWYLQSLGEATVQTIELPPEATRHTVTGLPCQPDRLFFAVAAFDTAGNYSDAAVGQLDVAAGNAPRPPGIVSAVIDFIRRFLSCGWCVLE